MENADSISVLGSALSSSAQWDTVHIVFLVLTTMIMDSNAQLQMPHGKLINANCVGQLSACSSLAHTWSLLSSLPSCKAIVWGQDKKEDNPYINPIVGFNRDTRMFFPKLVLTIFWERKIYLKKQNMTWNHLTSNRGQGCKAARWLWFQCRLCYYGPFSHCRWELPASYGSGNSLPLCPHAFDVETAGLICFSEVQLIRSRSLLAVADLLQHPAPYVQFIMACVQLGRVRLACESLSLFWVGFSSVTGKSWWR